MAPRFDVNVIQQAKAWGKIKVLVPFEFLSPHLRVISTIQTHRTLINFSLELPLQLTTIRD